jgi:ribose/xylose/arabinose/galactoside ABC-type transport system permease subunit
LSGARAALRRLGPLAGLAATWALFALAAGGPFTALSNQRLMLLQTAVVGTAAIGATLIIVAGGIDLSVGSTIALGTVVGALCLPRAGGAGSEAFAGLARALGLPAAADPWLAAAAAVACGVAVGLAIGALVVGRLASAAGGAAALAAAWWVAREGHAWFAPLAFLAVLAPAIALDRRLLRPLPLPPFIATLGLWGALRGLAKGLGDNQPVYPDSIGWIAELMVPADAGVLAWLPPGVLLLAATAAGAAVLLRSTVYGRQLYAIGSSEEAARACGVAIERSKLLVYGLGVGCAGLAALLQLSFLSMGDPTTASGYELRVIAAAVIGGASLSGGQGTIGGTLVGALLMTVVDNGCTKLGLDNWVQECATGAIIVAAVALDRLRGTIRSS